MSDSTNTPHQPDDHGRVATGGGSGRPPPAEQDPSNGSGERDRETPPQVESGAEPNQPDAAAPASAQAPPVAGEPAGSEPAGSEPAGYAAAGSEQAVGENGCPASDDQGSGVEPGPERRSTGGPAPEPGAGPVSPNGADRRGDAFTAPDPPTEQVRVVPAAGDAGRPSEPVADASRPEGARSRPAPPQVRAGDRTQLAQGDRMQTAGGENRVPPPRPGPGNAPPPPRPVPGPGPAAATPPPWRRVPGQETSGAPVPVESSGPTALLQEMPTAFMEPDAGAGGRPPDGESSPDTGWSAVRSVRNRPPRQAALQLRRLDPWSVLKLGLVLSVVVFCVWMVAVGVLYGVLDGMGVWDLLNGSYADLVSSDAAPTGGTALITAGRVFALAGVVGAINSLLFAVAVTLGAFVYNVSADLVGGAEVTLSERD